jgi:hypothetical protein
MTVFAVASEIFAVASEIGPDFSPDIYPQKIGGLRRLRKNSYGDQKTEGQGLRPCQIWALPTWALAPEGDVRGCNTFPQPVSAPGVCCFLLTYLVMLRINLANPIEGVSVETT